jgi:very-short-patch-repair endonuclease
MNIQKKDWHICKICNSSIEDLAKKYGGNGIYYTEVFIEHLDKDHEMAIDEYFDNPPICPCGVCKKEVGIKVRGSNISWKKMACGRHRGTLEWAEKAKESRKGSRNPMYGATPWNKGLSKETDERVLSASKKLKGRTTPKEIREKQSLSAKNRKIHGNTGNKHSEESKQKMREATLKRIENGEFKQTKSIPHLKMCDILQELKIDYEEERVVDCWSFDIYLVDLDVYIEVDGDYFHSNPRSYPNGPRTKTQKINKYRDIKKNEYCKKNNLELIRFWEYDILNNKKEIICRLEKLNQ